MHLKHNFALVKIMQLSIFDGIPVKILHTYLISSTHYASKK